MEGFLAGPGTRLGRQQYIIRLLIIFSIPIIHQIIGPYFIGSGLLIDSNSPNRLLFIFSAILVFAMYLWIFVYIHSITIRRLHDIGHSGKWASLIIISYILVLIMSTSHYNITGRFYYGIGNILFGTAHLLNLSFILFLAFKKSAYPLIQENTQKK